METTTKAPPSADMARKFPPGLKDTHAADFCMLKSKFNSIFSSTTLKTFMMPSLHAMARYWPHGENLIDWMPTSSCKVEINSPRKREKILSRPS